GGGSRSPAGNRPSLTRTETGAGAAHICASSKPCSMRRVPAREQHMRPRPDTEVQQHDAIERLHHTFEVHRRDFFKLLGAGLLVGTASIHVSTQESGAGRRSRPEMPENLDSW